MADVEVVGDVAGEHPARPPEPPVGPPVEPPAEPHVEPAAELPAAPHDEGDQPPSAPGEPAHRPSLPEGAVLVRAADGPATQEPARARRAPRGARRARLHAVKILYQADLRGLTPEEALDRLEGDPRGLGLLDDLDDTEAGGAAVGGARRRRRRAEAGSPLDELARLLVLGVHGHREQIDALISRHARRWAIHRMPVIDRSVLRLATFELLDGQLPAAVVINEAVDLAKSLSTDDSGRFVNGVLDTIGRDLARELPDEPPDVAPHVAQDEPADEPADVASGASTDEPAGDPASAFDEPTEEEPDRAPGSPEEPPPPA